MKKRKCITKVFHELSADKDMDIFINEYLEKYDVIDIKQLFHGDYLYVTII